jgi:PleD family two-component response regulator
VVVALRVASRLMDHSDSNALVVRPDSQIALMPGSNGPMAKMIADALCVVAEGQGTGEREKLRILLADNDTALVRYLGELLSPNFDVSTAADASSAMLAIKTSQFDALIVSAGLPGVAASAFLEWMQRTRAEVNERLILTMNPGEIGDGSDLASLCDAGRVLRKPVRLDQWDDALLSVLKRVRRDRFRMVESIFAL